MAAAGDGEPTPDDGAPPRGDRVLVVIPTYNEIENLAEMVGRVHTVLPAARVLVVDDGSPDGTGDLADGLAAADRRVQVMHHRPRAGLGAAYVDAFARVIASHDADETAWIVQMDADGSHAPEDLPSLMAATVRADAVVGSRYVPGGKVVDWPWYRFALSRAGNAYSRWALRLPVRDVTGGFRVFTRDVLEKVPLHQVASQGYCFQVDLIMRIQESGFLVAEVPITFAERTRGSSKMSGAIVREAIWRVTGWALRSRFPVLDRRARPPRG